MKIVRLVDLCFRYQNSETINLQHINLEIETGEFIVFTGKSGCGKSTLLNIISGVLAKDGKNYFSGSMYLKQNAVLENDFEELSPLVAMVVQNPEDQLFAETVYEEVAFALKNKRLPKEEIHKKVLTILQFVGLQGMEERDIRQLSGGQQQRLALASMVVHEPELLILDEPLSQIDPQGARDLLTLLCKLIKKYNMTILMAEHRLHEVLEFCDRLIIMEGGKIVSDNSIQKIVANALILKQFSLRVPPALMISEHFSIQPPTMDREILIKEMRKKEFHIDHTLPSAMERTGSDALILKNITYKYGNHTGINAISLCFKSNSFNALIGANGSGKSTLLKIIGGLLKPQNGKIETGLQTSMILQNPDLMLFNYTVKEEVLCEAYNKGVTVSTEDYERIMESFSLLTLEERFPLSLSKGQRFRVAIAGALLSGARILLLDEPTTGQDIYNIEKIMEALLLFCKNGGTVIFATHDLDTIIQYAERSVILSRGVVHYDGLTKDMFDSLDKITRIPTVPCVSKAVVDEYFVNVEDFIKYAG